MLKLKCQMKNVKAVFIFLYAITISLEVYCQSTAQIPLADKIRIAEAILISKKYGDPIWPGFSEVPFRTILVTDSTEFLIHHEDPSSDFQTLGFDSLLQSDVYYRKRQYPPNLLAAFPAVNGQSTIVIGVPENTGHSSSEWIITYLHEHFHQYAHSSSDYYQSVNALNLSEEDESGMWMLNYPFPYEDRKVAKRYQQYTKVLKLAIQNRVSPSFNRHLKSYIRKRHRFKNHLVPKDYAYLSFQLWQEGIARYTEYKLLESLVQYSGSRELQALSDYISFSELKKKLETKEMEKLAQQQLCKEKRACFYATGFAEGLLLDHINPKWRSLYFKEKFFLEKYLP